MIGFRRYSIELEDGDGPILKTVPFCLGFLLLTHGSTVRVSILTHVLLRWRLHPCSGLNQVCSHIVLLGNPDPRNKPLKRLPTPSQWERYKRDHQVAQCVLGCGGRTIPDKMRRWKKQFGD